ncbi:flagellar brake protein [Halothiobacillus neapolitanus]|uniref:Type IV pilus assembly PilZ n=1 Tax=Halothiobacillus neapolitanus (strain ATCC 23641 / DSM 15147 / CIP 104769 / NCIMB 8539 / c2) TaxID=555778 RepID=D0L1V6_HALNC|nr:PilZ domain-containing protein [Halothiobacillus neapolitanus]ACX96679.1 type IV pilus assembly PilZ [Halothiobacillus neapolitanus c2]TDN65211.1 c-di-GMP-binding flagellar brake protein YcgR [Halothiobacillus neapolitanus]
MSQQDTIITARSPRIIDKILARHFEERGHFWLIPEGDEDFQIAVQMVSNDPENRRFLIDQPKEVPLRHLKASGRIRVQAVIDQLVSWFYVNDLKEKIEGTDRYFEIPYPAQIDRLQRRNVFRVHIPPDVIGVVEFFQPTTSTLWVGRLDDLSAGGCAIALRPDQAIGLDLGVQLSPVKLSIDGFADLSVNLVIRNQRIVSPGEWIFGAEFVDLGPLESQQLDRVVMRLQRYLI